MTVTNLPGGLQKVTLEPVEKYPDTAITKTEKETPSITNWVTEAISNYKEKAGSPPLLGDFLASGWVVDETDVEDDITSYVLKKTYVHFGNVLASMWDQYHEQYSVNVDTANGVLAQIETLHSTLDLYLSDPEMDLLPPEFLYMNSLEKVTETVDAWGNPETVTDSILPAVSTFGYVGSKSYIEQAEKTVNDAIADYKTKMKAASSLTGKTTTKYETKIGRVKDTYNLEVRKVIAELKAGFNQFELDVKGLMDNFGESGRTRIELAFVKQTSEAEQGLINSHAKNSLTWPGIKAGIESEKQIALTDFEDSLLMTKLDIFNTIYANLNGVKDQLVQNLESIRSGDLQAISMVLPDIHKSTEVLMSAYEGYVQTVIGSATQIASMKIDADTRKFDMNLQIAQMEMQCGMEKNQLALQYEELKSQSSIARAGTKMDLAQARASLTSILDRAYERHMARLPTFDSLASIIQAAATVENAE